LIFAKNADGYIFSSAPYVHDFGQEYFDIFAHLGGLAASVEFEEETAVSELSAMPYMWREEDLFYVERRRGAVPL